MPSNGYITSAHALQPWRGGEQDLLREGQIMFSGRSISADKSNKLAKMVSMQHLARILSAGFRRARADLEAGRLPEGNNQTLERSSLMLTHSFRYQHFRGGI